MRKFAFSVKQMKMFVHLVSEAEGTFRQARNDCLREWRGCRAYIVLRRAEPCTVQYVRMPIAPHETTTQIIVECLTGF